MRVLQIYKFFSVCNIFRYKFKDTFYLLLSGLPLTIAFKTLFLNFSVRRTLSQGAYNLWLSMKAPIQFILQDIFWWIIFQGENLFVKVIIIWQVNQGSFLLYCLFIFSKHLYFCWLYKCKKKGVKIHLSIVLIIVWILQIAF